jgi:rhodanese-related sulfurtransferase
MKIIYAVAALLTLVFPSCQSQPVQGSVDAITFSTKIHDTKSAVIIDVRTPEEYAGGFIGNAVNMDYYSPSFKSDISKLDKSQTYFVYCQGGGRSKSAAEVMQKEGFTKVYELNGGMSEWEASNLPVTHKPD